MARQWSLVFLLGLSLAACTTPPPPPAPPPAPEAAARVKPRGDGGSFRIGEPYRINGVLYTPQLDWNYDRSGRASWYGRGFQGRRTANGETYDQNDLTAAHQTLPLPSIVRVTNLQNGRAIVLRVNDRGPFVKGRILDVSRKASQMLGFHSKGTAHVRVEVLEKESRQAAAEAGWQG